ncbi:MAG: metallophosphoesterase [Treponema sp.]|nr:metallophosphoesterase [Treponema sp.]
MDFSFCENFRLPSHDEIFSAAEKMCNLLEEEQGEKAPYRPSNSKGNPGGLIDFSSSEKPVLIIPDLHARPDFLKQVLDFKIKEKSVLELLESKEIFLVFLGDALHSEKITKESWLLCQKEFDGGVYDGKYMQQEMSMGLSLLMMLFELKTNFSENFHFLKGNHENIMNNYKDGDFPFRKYADEGRMVKKFISTYYGDDVLYMLSLYENSLPLVFLSSKCVISHAEPKRYFSKNEIIDARLDGDVVSGLIWTANNEAEENSVQSTLESLLGEKKEKVFWFGGHRPVSGKYALRQKGRFVQFHNPLLRNIVYLECGKEFDPETDIVNVTGGSYE